MSFYRCDNCEHVFRDGDGKTVRDHMGVTDPYPVYQEFIGCPECGCTDLEDFVPCDTDDCEAEAAEGYDYCAACQARMDAEEAECQDYPAPPAPEGVRPLVSSRRTEPDEGRGAAILLMVAMVVACVWMAD